MYTIVTRLEKDRSQEVLRRENAVEEGERNLRRVNENGGTLKMKKLMGSLMAVFVLASNSVYATEIDMLVNKLAEKNVISYGEARQIITETNEEVRKNMAAGKVETMPKWLQKLSIDGVIYADYYYNASAGVAPGSTDAFELTRVYLTVREQVSDRVNMRVTLEGAQPANTLWVKYAYAEYSDIFRGSNIRFGVIETPWISYEEGLWKNRFMAKVFPDNEGILNSADIGAALKGNILGKRVNYDAIVMNGEGYKTPEVNKYKDVAARVSVDLVEGLKLQTYGHLGTQGAPGVTQGDRNRTIAGFSYQWKDLSAMAYYLSTKDLAAQGSGYTAWATYWIIPQLSIVARYDFYDQNTGTPNNSWYRVIGGLVTPICQNVLMSIDVQTKNYESPVQGNNQIIYYTHMGLTF